jgi:hypothetical protein
MHPDGGGEVMDFLLLVLWVAVGAAGLLYWWTTEFDFTLSGMSLFLVVYGAFLGPFSWFVGWVVALY